MTPVRPDHAATVRNALQRIHCVDDHGYVYEGVDTDALAALDALEAELAEARRERDMFQGYEINPHAVSQKPVSVQAFSVVQGDDQIRTGESDQRIDCPPINPESGA